MVLPVGNHQKSTKNLYISTMCWGLIFRRMQIAFDAVRGRIGFRVP
jgi:hypothetical protein